MDRRDVLIGAACIGAAATAYSLVPRRHVSLLGSRNLDAIVPRSFAGWTSRDTSDLVAPTDPDSLASRLYGVTVGRLYQQDGTGTEVMMLLAHGDSQSDDLQVHRPEICYPAFGFALTENHPTAIAVGDGVAIPARHMVATSPDRRETVLYWTRLGEFLPQDHRQQQLDRMRTAMQGEVADGLLARFSVTGADAATGSAEVAAFVPALVRATRPENRAVLIGTLRAQALIRAGL